MLYGMTVNPKIHEGSQHATKKVYALCLEPAVWDFWRRNDLSFIFRNGSLSGNHRCSFSSSLPIAVPVF